MLTRACFVTVLAATALGACGGDGDGDGDRTSPPRQSTTAAPARATAVAGQDELPERPQVTLDFRMTGPAELAVDRAARGRIAAGALELELRASGTARAATRERPPDDTPVTLVIGRVRDPQRLRGRAGIFCRGDRSGGGYELTIDRTGRVRLDRIAGGRRATLAHGQARLDAASPPDSPIPLFLVCGRGDEDEGPHIVFTVGAQEPAGVRDPEPPTPATGALAGMLVSGDRGDRARFAVFTLTYGP